MSASADTGAPAAWREVHQQFAAHGPACDSAVLHITLDQQAVYLLSANGGECHYPVSTSRYGAGCRDGSHQTPLGRHVIAEKIGAGAAPGSVFRARRQVGAGERGEDPDPITSRILWLRGLEPGVNSGAGLDTHARYIYIHGTPHESCIGTPASIGCIRMLNADVIALFDRVEVGTPVLITATRAD